MDLVDLLWILMPGSHWTSEERPEWKKKLSCEHGEEICHARASVDNHWLDRRLSVPWYRKACKQTNTASFSKWLWQKALLRKWSRTTKGYFNALVIITVWFLASLNSNPAVKSVGERGNADLEGGVEVDTTCKNAKSSSWSQAEPRKQIRSVLFHCCPSKLANKEVHKELSENNSMTGYNIFQ